MQKHMYYCKHLKLYLECQLRVWRILDDDKIYNPDTCINRRGRVHPSEAVQLLSRRQSLGRQHRRLKAGESRVLAEVLIRSWP